MRALKIAGAAIAAVIVVLALLAIIGIPSGLMTSAIQARVERETGYRLTIAGATRIGLWPTLNVTLNDVTLQDPKDRDGLGRLTVGSVKADMTLGSVWSGRPQITELVISRPVLYVPLLRERSGPLNPPTRPAVSPGEAADATAPVIERVTVSRRRGRIFQPARPRQKPHRGHQCQRRDRRRPQGQDRRQCEGRRAAAQIRTRRHRARAPDRAAEHSGRTQARGTERVAGAAVGQGRGAAQRPGAHDQRALRRDRRRRVQRLGVGGSVQQAAGQTRSRFPAA